METPRSYPGAEPVFVTFTFAFVSSPGYWREAVVKRTPQPLVLAFDVPSFELHVVAFAVFAIVSVALAIELAVFPVSLLRTAYVPPVVIDARAPITMKLRRSFLSVRADMSRLLLDVPREPERRHQALQGVLVRARRGGEVDADVERARRRVARRVVLRQTEPEAAVVDGAVARRRVQRDRIREPAMRRVEARDRVRRERSGERRVRRRVVGDRGGRGEAAVRPGNRRAGADGHGRGRVAHPDRRARR